jgi:hypothetical protein
MVLVLVNKETGLHSGCMIYIFLMMRYDYFLEILISLDHKRIETGPLAGMQMICLSLIKLLIA